MNPGYRLCQYTRSPGALLKPLGHLSADVSRGNEVPLVTVGFYEPVTPFIQGGVDPIAGRPREAPPMCSAATLPNRRQCARKGGRGPGLRARMHQDAAGRSGARRIGNRVDRIRVDIRVSTGLESTVTVEECAFVLAD